MLQLVEKLFFELYRRNAICIAVRMFRIIESLHLG